MAKHMYIYIYIYIQYLNPLTWLMSCKHDVTNPTMSFDENSSCAGFHSKVYHHSPVGFSKEGCPLRLSTKQWKGQHNNRSMTELISLIIYEWDVLKCIGVSMYPPKKRGSRTQRVNEPTHFADEKSEFRGPKAKHREPYLNGRHFKQNLWVMWVWTFHTAVCMQSPADFSHHFFLGGFPKMGVALNHPFLGFSLIKAPSYWGSPGWTTRFTPRVPLDFHHVGHPEFKYTGGWFIECYPWVI